MRVCRMPDRCRRAEQAVDVCGDARADESEGLRGGTACSGRGSLYGGRRTGGRGEGGSLVRGLGVVAESADERGQQPESAWLAQPAEHLARGAHARPQLPDEGIQAHPHLWAHVRKTEHDGRAQEPLHLGECRGRLPRHHERLDAAQALDFTLSRMFADCSMASRLRERLGANGKDDNVIEWEIVSSFRLLATILKTNSTTTISKTYCTTDGCSPDQQARSHDLSPPRSRSLLAR